MTNQPAPGRAGVAPSLERCERCGIKLLPNEHTRAQGICHSCWADDIGASTQEPLSEAALADGAAAPEGVGAGSGPQGAPCGARADLAAMLWNYALHRKRTAN